MVKEEIFLNQQLLHHGTDFSVYRFTTEDGIVKILKVLNSSSPDSAQIAHFNNEFYITQKLSIEGVRKIYGQTKYLDCPALVMEHISGNDLEEFVGKGLPVDVFLPIAINLAEITGNIHLNHITHKDINGRNILYNNETKDLKVIDFGMSTMLNTEHQSLEHSNMVRGTMTHISPEQTGRMNRKVDYRSDIYSLGITFYHMLSGVYPFFSDDPLELIHYHIAREPDLDKLPYPLNHIIGKMLSKNADERYNSAFGVKNDLLSCQDKLQTGNGKKSFIPGLNDYVLTFTIRQKLYGRQEEIKTLLNEFKTINKGHTRMLLVAGYSGVGKTTLINEIHRPISIKKGFFSTGKFDQYHRNIPYYAFIQAFQVLIEQILTEPEEKLAEWKTRIQEAVGINGQLIIDVIPIVKHIIGEQNATQTIPTSEANNRFNRVLLNFVKVFAKEDHPLVLFLDDLQWADIASLKFMEQLMAQVTNHYLLILGAYRDNEVDQAHPLTLSLNEIKENGSTINTLWLKPLELVEINQLVSDSIQNSPETTLPLSTLVHKKTGGNPFFVAQFMNKLSKENKLNFSMKTHQWEWDLEAIKDENITENVVDLMKSNILKLPKQTIEVLKLAACIGNEFDLKTIATVSQLHEKKISKLLWPSLEIGLIVPLDDYYKIYGNEEYEEYLSPGINAKFSFLHDRIQQAAYSLIPDEERIQLHLDIGKNLLHGKSDSEVDSRLFDILQHINQGVDLIKDEKERIAFARLNNEAAKKAKASAAYSASLKFFEKASKLLGPDSLQKQYDFSFPLHLDYAEVSYLSGNITKAESLLDSMLAIEGPRLNKAKIYIQKSIMYLMTTNMEASKKACKNALELFDISVPEKVTYEVLLEAYGQLEKLRAGRPIADFYNLPELTDADQYMLFIIYFNYATPAYFTDQNLWIWIIYQEIGISIKYGNSDFSDAVYCAFGLILGSGLGDYDSGFAYGELGKRLNEKYNNVSNRAKICVVFGQMNSHWKRHFKYNLPLAKEGYLIGNETGDLTYAGTNAFHSCWCTFLMGKPLKKVMEECERYEDYFIKTKQNLRDSIRVELQMIKALSGQTESLTTLSDETFKEEEFVNQLSTSPLQIPIHTYYLAKERLFYFAGQYEQVLEMAHLAKPVNFSSLGMGYTPEEFYFEALAHVGNCREKNIELPQTVNDIVNRFSHWAKHSPDNFLHKLELIQAEILSLKSEKAADDLYDKAILHANEGDFLQEEALVNELAALHYFRNSNLKLARAYMTESRNQYQVWGALAKVKNLELHYPHLLYGKSTAEHFGQKTAQLITSTQDLMLEPDIQTILKASTAISGEVKIENLLRTLINITIENAGAQKGTIILKENDIYLIKASKLEDGTIEVLQDTPLQKFEDLSKSVVQFVIRTKDNIVLDDASENERFAKDPYIKKNKTRSILCMPIISKGNLIGILYLENNLTTNAFTSHRLDLLRLISGQIATSIDNAFLYENLEKKVKERTFELEKEKEISDKLLRNILPEETAEELKKTGTAIPKSYEMVSILFTDFKGFTRVSEKLTPKEIIEKLDYCFASFDKIITKYNLEKIKTIGDSYMCAGGIPAANTTNALDAVRAGIEIQEFIETWNINETAQKKETWQVRIGINTGKVVAGVVGQSKFAYDIWGDAVNLASAMEQSGEVGRVNISQSTYELVKEQFNCTSRGKIKAKNKGEVEMFFVDSPKKENN